MQYVLFWLLLLGTWSSSVTSLLSESVDQTLFPNGSSHSKRMELSHTHNEHTIPESSSNNNPENLPPSKNNVTLHKSIHMSLHKLYKNISNNQPIIDNKLDNPSPPKGNTTLHKSIHTSLRKLVSNLTRHADRLQEQTNDINLDNLEPTLVDTSGILPEPTSDDELREPKHLQFHWVTVAPKFGIFLLVLILTAYMILGEYLVCREFFVPSVLLFADHFKLSTDTVGGTVVAIAVTTPLLFLNFLEIPDVGLMTWSNLNTTFAIAMCCFCRRRNLEVLVSWWTLNRGASFYLFLLVVTYCLMSHVILYWYDALFMMVCFVGYSVYMVFDQRLRERYFISTEYSQGINNEETALYMHQPTNSGVNQTQEISMYTSSTGKGYVITGIENPSFSDRRDQVQTENEKNAACVVTESGATTLAVASSLPGAETNVPLDAAVLPTCTQLEDFPLSMAWPQTWGDRFFYVITFPVKAPLWFTLPDVRKPEKREQFLATLAGSVVWILVFHCTWAFLLKVEGWSGTGVAVICFGVVVVRRGLGDMAISAIFGSRIVELTLGFPLPCFISCLIKGYVIVFTTFWYVLLPLLVQVILSSYLYLSSRRLNTKLGCLTFFLPLISLVVILLIIDLSLERPPRY